MKLCTEHLPRIDRSVPLLRCVPLLAAALLASCASTYRPGLAIEDSSDDTSSREAAVEFRVELPALEAACLVAEALAYEFPNTQRDSLRPVARALRIEPGRWRIAYVRGRGGYVPLSHGHFESAARSSRLAHSTRRSKLFELLPRLRFVPQGSKQAGSPARVNSFVVCEILHVDAENSIVRASSLDSHARWGRKCVTALEKLLRGSAAIGKGLDLCAAGNLDRGAARLGTALAEHRAGFSHVHDPVLANAFAALGRVEFERGRLHEARIAFARSRLLVPANTQVARLEAQLHERLAQSGRSQDLLRSKSLLEPSRGLAARHLAAIEQVSRELVATASKARASRSIAAASLEAGDAQSALSWADRALDIHPGESEALVLRAKALSAQGRFGEADRSLRLAHMAAGDSRAGKAIQALLASDARGVAPAIAFRRILRSSFASPEVLNHQTTGRLVARLGAERCLRICQTEGIDPRTLETSARILQSDNAGARAGFLALLIASAARYENAGDPRIELEARDLEPDRIGGASGLRTSPVNRSKPRTVGPTR